MSLPDKNNKVGTSTEAARRFGGKKDFGAHESDRVEREYASRATRSQDKGGLPPHATGEGQRVSGVGARESGPGSGSGGDLDTDIIGIGTGAGVAASGAIHQPPGPDDVPPSAARQRPDAQKPAPRRAPGTTFDRSGGDASTTGAGQGAAAASDPVQRNDDAAAGEISMDEAAGADNSPSDNTGADTL